MEENYTHTYKTISGIKMKCFIDKKFDFWNFRVINENGVGVLLKRWNIKKIRK